MRSPMESAFTEIYRAGSWGGGESASGPGSGIVRTAALRRDLAELLRKRGVRSMLDAGCGDFHWMKEAGLDLDRYVGVDVVGELVAQDRARYADSRREFHQLDLTRDPLPRADLVLCRDTLVHLAFQHALAAIANLKRSGSRFLLATTFDACDANVDVPTSDWRRLNMRLEPFGFPPPLESISDRRPDGSFADKRLGLWELSACA